MEILSWLLSYGAHAELLAPEQLRGELGRMVQETALLYEREMDTTQELP
jgi:proteasome accessory factor B